MLKDVVEARVLGDHRLWLRFEDGIVGEVDFASHFTFDGVFAPLRDPARFAEVRVVADWGTVAWPTGADLDPDVLYSIVSGVPLPDEATEPRDSAA
jgi:hypothetical protein